MGQYFLCKLSLIRGEPARAPNTRESGSGVYLFFIYLYTWSCMATAQCACSDTTCLLWLIEVVINDVSLPNPRFSSTSCPQLAKLSLVRSSPAAIIFSVFKRLLAYKRTSQLISEYSWHVFAVDFWKRRLNLSIEGCMKGIGEALWEGFQAFLWYWLPC